MNYEILKEFNKYSNNKFNFYEYNKVSWKVGKIGYLINLLLQEDRFPEQINETLCKYLELILLDRSVAIKMTSMSYERKLSHRARLLRVNEGNTGLLRYFKVRYEQKVSDHTSFSW